MAPLTAQVCSSFEGQVLVQCIHRGRRGLTLKETAMNFLLTLLGFPRDGGWAS